MPDPTAEQTLPPKSRSQKILDELNKGEGKAAALVGRAAAWAAAHPHAALALWAIEVVLVLALGIWIGRP